MEKLSLYDLLSFLLPGAVACTLFYFRFLVPMDIDFSKVNDQLEMVIFIAISFFVGSLIHYSFELKLFEVLIKKLGLYQRISNIYNSPKVDIQVYVKEAFKDDFLEFAKLGVKDSSEQIEHFWSKIYYKLEAEDKITTSKSFQSFYFFFRNIATLSIITIIIELISSLFTRFKAHEIPVIIIAIVVLVLSTMAGRMHRRKMVSRMFWTYYSLYKFNK